MRGYPRFILVFSLIVGVLLLALFVFDAMVTDSAKNDPEPGLRQDEYETPKRGFDRAFREKYGLDPIWSDILIGGVIISGLFVLSSILYFALRPKRRRPLPRRPYRR
ncbi:MAG: hypothetical protein KAV82_10320 [Phycisphaerae bacterium]|nr:hypothetical protein [Phycisphaerae bacterium]